MSESDVLKVLVGGGAAFLAGLNLLIVNFVLRYFLRGYFTRSVFRGLRVRHEVASDFISAEVLTGRGTLNRIAQILMAFGLTVVIGSGTVWLILRIIARNG